MPLIHAKGSPTSRIWVIADAPLSTDDKKGYMFSGGAGYVFDRMMLDAGIKDYFVMALRPDTDKPDYAPDWTHWFHQFKPPFIIFIGAAGQHWLKQLEKTQRDKSYKTPLSKYVGSLLTSDKLNFPHYAMPLLGIEVFLADWAERQIATYFDLQKLREEYAYWKASGRLQPYPFRQLLYKDMEIGELLTHLSNFQRSSLISVDIETCYPKSDSEFFPHPGYPLTIGIADSPYFGISFNLFRESQSETLMLWRALDSLLATVPQLGQNYFNFDAHYLQMLGFKLPLNKCIDTLIRHHVLWPELPHKLQFQTRQYTREIYYKDEGHRWSLKNMDGLRRYNCLDVCTTFEIYLEQETEFNQRTQLR
jgi:hypothetical protein